MNNKLKLISLAVMSTLILAACNGSNTSSSSNSNQQIDPDTIPPVGNGFANMGN
jgi:ABC-type oligopeptide transport system substrate-binding subunit